MQITDEMLACGATALSVADDCCTFPCSVDNSELCACYRGARAVIAAVAPLIIEDRAKAVDYSLCDVAEDAELFGAHRDFFAATIRALKDA